MTPLFEWTSPTQFIAACTSLAAAVNLDTVIQGGVMVTMVGGFLRLFIR